MFKKGNRIFSIAIVLLLVVAVMHTMGAFNEPVNEAGVELVTAMKTYTVTIGAMTTNVRDIQMSLALTMTVFMVFLGLLDITIVSSAPPRDLLRRVILLNALCMWALVILYWEYQVFPPFISFVVVGLVFTAAYVLERGADGPAD